MLQDNSIVDLFLKRDESAIRHTADKYGSKLRALAQRIVGDESTAEECENDTYLRAWNSIPPADPSEYFFSYLAKIIRFLAIDRYRQMKRDSGLGELVELTQEIENAIPGQSDVEGEFQGQELGEMISDFLRTIPEEKRNIFLRRYWFMDSIPEIAKRYSYSEGKVKTVLFRVRNELRIYLGKEGYHV